MKKEKKPGNEKKGFPLSKFNYILEAVVLVVSVLLLITTFRVNGGYQRLKEISDHYIECERQATQLEISSDTLTREARLFANEKGKEHIDAYFAEKDSGNREYAVSVIKTFFFEDSDIVKALQRALEESQKLEQTEYTAMRLTLESMGVEAGYEAASREEIKNAELPLGAENMTRAEKWELAKALVNGQEYYNAKDKIIGNVDICILNMINEVKTRQDTAEHSLDLLLIQQRVWLVLFIAAAVAVITVTSVQIIRPLNRAVPYIRNDSAIPVSGAEEFRLLVKTYNRMHRINQTYRDKLAYRANHDPLTGVLNRNGMEDILHSTSLENAALLILDIDHFKQINDEHGHAMGDRVLTTVSQSLQSMFRGEDIVCRMGGDEFVVIMWNSGPELRELIAGKIQKINEELAVGADGLPSISVSAGVAFGAECPNEDIFHCADMALYETKTTGRAGCTFYKPE